MDWKIIITLLIILLIVGIASAEVRKFEVDEGALVKLRLEARDPDGDEVTYKFEPPLNGNGEWQTGYKDAGEYMTKVTAVDSKGGETSEDVLIVVNDVNLAPIIPGGDITINEGELLDLRLPKHDIDGDVIEYTITGKADETGKWQTDYNDAGEYDITVVSKDGKLGHDGKPASSTAEFKVIVNDIDRAPEVENIEKFVYEGDDIKVSFPKKDPDGDSITYTADILPEGAELDGYKFGWMPSYDTIVEKDNSLYIVSYRIPLKKRIFSGEKTFLIQMTAASKGIVNPFNLTIHVQNKNREPIISGIEDTITIKETETLVLKADISDPDNDPISTYYYLNGEELDSNKFVTGYDSEGEYSVMIEATDGNLTSKKAVKIIVENKNREPYLKKDKIVVKEGEQVSFMLDAADDDSQEVGIKAIDLPKRTDYVDDAKTIEFEPKYNLVLHNENYTANFFDHVLNKVFGSKRFQKWMSATFELDDGIDEVDRNFTIIVKDVNRAPVVEDIDREIKVREGEPLYIPLKGYDPDDDELRYRFKGIVSKNNETLGYDKQGEYNITVIVTDGKLKAETTVQVEVIDMNQPPEFKLHDTYTVREGETLRIPLSAKDFDGDEIGFRIEDGPEDAMIENNTIIWTAPFDTVQHYIKENKTTIRNPIDYNDILLTIVAYDNDYDTIVNTTIQVLDVNQAPIVKDWYPATRFRVKQGQVIEFFVSAEDPDNDPLNYTWYPSKFKKISDDNVHTRKLITTGLRDFKVVVSDGDLDAANAWQFYVRN